MSDRASPSVLIPPDDRILPFQIGETAVRGRLVRMSGSIDQILSAHPFDENVARLVGEAAIVVTLMGAALKFDGKLIFQIQGDGPVSMVVSDYQANGALRATASTAEGAARSAPTLPALLGTGHVAMTVDQGPDMERYQGITPLEGETLEEAVVAYFQQSEQLPTAVRLAVGKIQKPGGRAHWRAGGIIAQFVPGEGGNRERGEATLMADTDQESWDRAEAFLKTTQADELLDPNLAGEDLLYRLFHEDGVRVFDSKPVTAACGCNAQKITAVLGRYDEDSLSEMLEDGIIKVSCDFCRTEYRFDPQGNPIQPN
ncbi:MAG: Hsp33 family molecular chaperone [Pseudomonadota bacterium]